MSTLAGRLRIGLRASLPSIIFFFLLLNVLLAVDIQWTETRKRRRDPRHIFSLFDDTAVLFVAVGLSVLLPRLSLSLSV